MKIVMVMLMSICCCADVGDKGLQTGEEASASLPIRIFAPNFFQHARGARIFLNRTRQADRTSEEEVELCSISTEQNMAMLARVLERLTGYKLPNGSHPGKWELSIKMDDGRTISISHRPSIHDQAAMIKTEGGEFEISPSGIERIRGIFNCRNIFVPE
jgi:hypothetical protein